MSAFSDLNFKASNYSSYRPTYNKEFFDLIFTAYPKHKGSTALDIGCGTGQVTNELASHFEKVIGTDLSPKMIETAIEKNKDPRISYRVSGAEKLDFIDSGSVDVVTCGQLCHWFDHDVWLQEMYRILSSKGLLIYFGYADPVFANESIECNKLLDTVSYGDEWLGKYWEQPGRQIVRDLLVEVDAKLPNNKFEIWKSAKFDGNGENKSALKIERDMKFGDFMNYVTSWSSLHNYHKLNPQVLNTDKDLYRQIYKEFNTRYGWDLNKDLKVVWKTCYTIARKL